MRHEGFKRATKRGRLLLGLIILAIICTSIQIFTSAKLNQVKDREFKKEIAIRDSTNQFNTQELLAKYGLKVDRKNDEIVRILRDSSLKKTTIINGAAPYLKIDNIEMSRTADTTTFKVWYCSKEAISYNVNVFLDIYTYNATTDSFGTIFTNGRDITVVDIPKDQCIISSGHGFFDFSQHNNYIFHLHGTYENSDGKIIKSDYLHFYNYKEKNFGYLGIELHYKFLQYLENNDKKTKPKKVTKTN